MNPDVKLTLSETNPHPAISVTANPVFFLLINFQYIYKNKKQTFTNSEPALLKDLTLNPLELQDNNTAESVLRKQEVCAQKRFSISHSHQTNAALQINCQILHSEVELVEVRLNVGNGQPEVGEVPGKNPLSAQEVPGEGQQQVFTRL